MIEVQIWSDFACPFCYIGKKHFEKALVQFPQADKVQVTYRSFELDPSAQKSQSASINEVLAKKYGKTIEWAKEANQRVTEMAADVGGTFNLQKVIPTNSFDAHRLNQLALDKGLQPKIQDALFSAYFAEGKDLAEAEVLISKAVEVGISAEEIKEVLSSDKYKWNVRRDEEMARELGIQGVPFFLFNEKYAVSGAQPAEVFLEALKKVSI